MNGFAIRYFDTRALVRGREGVVKVWERREDAVAYAKVMFGSPEEAIGVVAVVRVVDGIVLD